MRVIGLPNTFEAMVFLGVAALVLKSILSFSAYAYVSFAIAKVDRSKLYGYKEAEILDEEESRCEFAVLADDGSTVIGKGDVGMGYLTVDGLWSSRGDLKPVDIEGNEITPVGSSFDSTIELSKAVDADEFLRHNIRLVYLLEPSSLSQKLRDSLSDGTILKFPYSYRGGLQADRGFIIQGTDGNFFLVVGDELEIEFVGLRQVAPTVEEGDADETDFMDFDMI